MTATVTAFPIASTATATVTASSIASTAIPTIPYATKLTPCVLAPPERSGGVFARAAQGLALLQSDCWRQARPEAHTDRVKLASRPTLDIAFRRATLPQVAPAIVLRQAIFSLLARSSFRLVPA